MLLNSETYFADFLRLHSWSMLEIGTGYSWDICGIFVGYLWDIRGVFVEYSLGIHEVFMGYTYVSGMCRVCIGYVSGKRGNKQDARGFFVIFSA